MHRPTPLADSDEESSSEGSDDEEFESTDEIDENMGEGKENIIDNINLSFSDGGECGICYGQFKEDDRLASPDVCDHVFCENCLTEWTKVKSFITCNKFNFQHNYMHLYIYSV